MQHCSTQTCSTEGRCDQQGQASNHKTTTMCWGAMHLTLFGQGIQSRLPEARPQLKCMQEEACSQSNKRQDGIAGARRPIATLLTTIQSCCKTYDVRWNAGVSLAATQPISTAKLNQVFVPC